MDLQNIRDKIRPYRIIHPIILAIYPLLTLHLTNYNQVSFVEVVPPLLASLAALFLLWVIGNRIIRNNCKTALLLTALYSLFFSCGQLLPSLSQTLFAWFRFDIRHALGASGR